MKIYHHIANKHLWKIFVSVAHRAQHLVICQNLVIGIVPARILIQTHDTYLLMHSRSIQ